jgi:hypothetical protein
MLRGDEWDKHYRLQFGRLHLGDVIRKSQNLELHPLAAAGPHEHGNLF